MEQSMMWDKLDIHLPAEVDSENSMMSWGKFALMNNLMNRFGVHFFAF